VSVGADGLSVLASWVSAPVTRILESSRGLRAGFRQVVIFETVPPAGVWQGPGVGATLQAAGLAALLLSRYDVLLLDEPTNALDLDGLERLEAFDEFAGTRAGLEERARMQRAWMDKGVRTARRKAPDSDKFGRAMRAIGRLEVVEEPRKEWRLRLEFAAAPRSGSVVAVLDHAVVRRGTFTLGPVDLQVDWADRVAVTGPNGAGKSTLIALLLGRLAADQVRASLGPGVVVGELDQARSRFDGEASLAAAFGTVVPAWPDADVRTLFAKFGLGGEHMLRPCASLSPGERTRAGSQRDEVLQPVGEAHHDEQRDQHHPNGGQQPRRSRDEPPDRPGARRPQRAAADRPGQGGEEDQVHADPRHHAVRAQRADDVQALEHQPVHEAEAEHRADQQTAPGETGQGRAGGDEHPEEDDDREGGDPQQRVGESEDRRLVGLHDRAAGQQGVDAAGRDEIGVLEQLDPVQDQRERRDEAEDAAGDQRPAEPGEPRLRARLIEVGVV